MSSVGAGGRHRRRQHRARMFMRLKPRARARRSRPTRSSRSCGRSWPQVPGIRVFLQNPPPIRVGGRFTKSQYQFTLQSPTPRSCTSIAAAAGGEDRRRCPASGRHQRPAAQEPAGQRARSTATRPPPWASRPSRSRTPCTAPTARGRSRPSTPPNNQYQVILELLPEYQPDPTALLAAVRPLRERGSWCRSTCRRPDQHGRRPAVRQPLRAAAVGDDLLQPAARRGAGRGGRRQVSGRPRTMLPGDHHHQLPGHGPGVPVLAARAWAAAGPGHPGHLHRAGHPLRELHPPAHDPVRPAVRGLRGAADAADLQRGADHLRLRRHHHADRPGQEERHHDDRLRHRGAAQRGQERRARRSTRPA